MKRIIWHHTGGAYTPNAVDRRAYHALIDGDGEVILGDSPVEANRAIRSPRDISTYAAHTRGLNTGSIGIAICGMLGGEWSNPRASRHFPRPAQVQGMLRLTADWCRKYGIPPTRKNVLSHAEVELTLGVWQRNKWDFDYDPRGQLDSRDPIAIGRALRADLAAMLGDRQIAPEKPSRPTIRRGSRGAYVAELQQRLDLMDDGIFGPQTDDAVRRFQAANELIPDGIVGPLTWGALL